MEINIMFLLSLENSYACYESMQYLHLCSSDFSDVNGSVLTEAQGYFIVL